MHILRILDCCDFFFGRINTENIMHLTSFKSSDLSSDILNIISNFFTVVLSFIGTD